MFNIWQKCVGVLFIAGIAIGWLAACSHSHHAEYNPNLPLKVALESNRAELPIVIGDDQAHVFVNLRVANFTENTIQLDSVSVRANRGGRLLQSWTYKNSEIPPLFSSIAGDYLQPQEPLLEPGEAGLFFLQLDLNERHTLPDTLSAQLTVQVEGIDQSQQTIHAPIIGLKNDGVRTIGSPLRGTNWWTPNGPGNFTHHRRVVIVLDGTVKNPEMYAVDWIQLGTEGKRYVGPEDENSSYHAYGAPIYAVADGPVVRMQDGIAENVPQSPTMAVPITIQTLPGNYVVQDIGGSRYAFYAHLQPNRVMVREGQRVRKGQIIGYLGNSGNSSEPHLHFHLIDGPDPLNSNGLPFALDRFVRKDYEMELDEDDMPLSLTVTGQEKVSKQIFMNEDLADL